MAQRGECARLSTDKIVRACCPQAWTRGGSCGERTASRGGRSILATLGRPEWVADSAAQYLAIARRLAADPAHLAQVRAGLRDEMRRSPLMDNAGFTRDVEHHYRAIWQRWCE